MFSIDQGHLSITRVANGFVAQSPRRGDYHSPDETHVFATAELLAAFVEKWALTPATPAQKSAR